MSTHMPGFKSFKKKSALFFVMEELATTSIRVNNPSSNVFLNITLFES